MIPSSDLMPGMAGKALHTKAVASNSMLRTRLFGLNGDCNPFTLRWHADPHIYTHPRSHHMVCEDGYYLLYTEGWNPMGLDELVVTELAGSDSRTLGSRGRLAPFPSDGDGAQFYFLNFTPQGIRIDISTKSLTNYAAGEKRVKALVEVYDLCKVTRTQNWICQRRTEWRSPNKGTLLKDEEFGYYLMTDESKNGDPLNTGIDG